MSSPSHAHSHRRDRDATRRSQRGTDESPWVKAMLIGVTAVFMLIFLLLPLANVFAQALGQGLGKYFRSLSHPETIAAIKLTLLVTFFAVPLNVIFGLSAAWCIAKFEFRGKALLVTLIDLPFSVSPVVAGLIYVVTFGLQGFLGPWLQQHDIRVIYAVPGIVLATLFITFPFVARELIPVMQATGTEQEQAAMTLGAGGWQTFWRVTLPSVKWALLYGIILCNARSLGEYGAVSVVSGHIAGKTDTLPLRVDKLYNEFDTAGAFSVASLLAILALFTLALKTYFEWKERVQVEGGGEPRKGSKDTIVSRP